MFLFDKFTTPDITETRVTYRHPSYNTRVLHLPDDYKLLGWFKLNELIVNDDHKQWFAPLNVKLHAFGKDITTGRYVALMRNALEHTAVVLTTEASQNWMESPNYNTGEPGVFIDSVYTGCLKCRKDHVELMDAHICKEYL